MGGYTDGEYNGGMAESSADYGGGITYEENQQYKVRGVPMLPNLMHPIF